jgi:hypothetical protein
MLNLDLSFLVSSLEFSKVIGLVLWSHNFLILLSEELLLEFNGSIVWSLNIINININWDDILLEDVNISLETILLDEGSLNNDGFLVKGLG